MKDIDVEDAVQNQNQENENLEEAQEEQGKPEVVEDKEDSLESKLAIAEKQAAEMQDAFLRAKAEGENIRRRAQEDIAKAHKFAIENFAQSMVAVKDSLEMAMKTDVPSVDSIKEGVDATLRQLKQVFEQNKIFEVVPEQGEKLDPMKHQAIQMVESDQDPNTIVSVLQKGYTLADRLLRPAVVVVAAPKKS
ncbi:nucleotide exchange factor GrpE [Oxalobacter aliiformigenes]|uniref:Protein GrpE n=1 Tax=Oxalobacter aliiformigenes TaxID=2946593 RepID=A0A9E9L9X7_9BURK|nr:nucleotide exchange factor GrpE [Oxalobacter aliiformigenes]WAV89200.1 nucleotide exchange factor GrpE [Oxalobacter aliiformigenes]WAV91213.1 nucleotide exchange factor GrpE [Oxalobacter aliiformigenes]WAV93300.1 nucleotide exchange factor GrpE [Oxalobacter aliiformigenes]WAV95199.1 nucleotide exchange factor GrpE [Oxalobacter aliiformigenes]WAV97000.1 nucleotide exchange factor GrpE [Oxalobacter aliiformigenes]